MTIRRPRTLALVPTAAALVAVAGSALPAAAQAPLPVGTLAEGSVPFGGRAEYTFEASSPGILTVMVRSDAADVRIRVTDADGQEVPDGLADIDFGGDVGAEQLAVVVPWAGTWRIRVETWDDDGAPFTIGATFLGTELVAGARDPDGSPSGARVVAVGEEVEDAIHPSAGDVRDWFRFDADGPGALTVLTRAPAGDLRIDVFRDGEFGEPFESSDQDLEGVFGNESVTVTVDGSAPVWIRVSPALGGDERIDYRLRSGLIPG